MPHYNFSDLTGQDFDAWHVIRRGPNDQRSRAQWICQCVCGTIRTVDGTSLRRRLSKSCGCVRDIATGNRVRTHGMVHSSEYKIWSMMRRRCSDPSVINYHNYGGRGITVCSAWNTSFEAFYHDMGPRPSPNHTLERVDNNLGYTPDNTIWLLASLQNYNKRTNRLLTFQGETACLITWARKTGIHQTTLFQRLKRGWSVEKALTTPPRPLTSHRSRPS
jgi:hypothetical protein